MLSERDRAILDLENQHWQFEGAKQAVIRDQFGLTGWQFYAALVRLAKDPAALAYNPVLVHRLQRRIERRAA